MARWLKASSHYEAGPPFRFFFFLLHFRFAQSLCSIRQFTTKQLVHLLLSKFCACGYHPGDPRVPIATNTRQQRKLCVQVLLTMMLLWHSFYQLFIVHAWMRENKGIRRKPRHHKWSLQLCGYAHGMMQSVFVHMHSIITLADQDNCFMHMLDTSYGFARLTQTAKGGATAPQASPPSLNPSLHRTHSHRRELKENILDKSH